jgi:tripeptidyl-peptidase-1
MLIVRRYFMSHDPSFKNYSTTDGVILTTGGIYNGVGRGYPDISAVGDAGLVVVAGEVGLSGGTSMSAPIVAGMFNLINEQRLQAGKPPVGFVNPTLYAYEEMFNDIVHGDMASNYSGEGQYGLCKGKGFAATRGWDPVTGMGTPKFEEILKIFLSLK